MRFQVWNDGFQQVESTLDKPVELGRQKLDEPPPFNLIDEGSQYRCVIAHHAENTISRNQLRLSTDGSKLVVTNLNSRRGIELDPMGPLGPGESMAIDHPTGFRFLGFEIRVLGDIRYEMLPNQTLAPGQLSGLRDQIQSIQVAGKRVSDSILSQQKLIQWLSKAMLVFQDAATSPGFLNRAAEVVREIVDLSTAAVLIRHGDRWETRAISASDDSGDSWQPSRTIIDLVAREKRTFYNLLEETSGAQSLMGVKAIVASPILSGENEVIGVVYGDRRTRAGSQVEQVEAVLVEVLASGVAAGLARVAQEEKAIRARADFERSFGKELCRHLEQNPEMLEGRIEEITILFADVSGFSAASEKIGPAKTMAWIGQVMQVMHEIVTSNHGVVVDYVGDELIAMWGAPAPQDNHALLACRTALEIHDRLNEANQRDEFLLPAHVRTGINTGKAHVGDTGTRYRLKYGAMGDTVNLASRIQGATKFFGCPILIAGATRKQLDDSLVCRRLGKVKVVNIERPIDLYELRGSKSSENDCAGYEQALAWMESGDVDSASGLIQKLAKENPTDSPTQVLRMRIDQMKLRNPDDTDPDPVWELPNK